MATMNAENLKRWLKNGGTVRHIGGTIGNLVGKHGSRGNQRLTLLTGYIWDQYGEPVPEYAEFPIWECDLLGEAPIKSS